MKIPTGSWPVPGSIFYGILYFALFLYRRISGPELTPGSFKYQHTIVSDSGYAARRKHKPNPATMSVFGMMWLFCWSIILPSMLSGAIGFFLDRYLESHTWTLIFLIGGLIIGSINAWILINRDIRSILVKHGKQPGKNYIK